MDKKDTSRMTRPVDVMEIKESLNMSEDIQETRECQSQSHKEENSNTRAISKINELAADNTKADMVNKATCISKNLQISWYNP